MKYNPIAVVVMAVLMAASSGAAHLMTPTVHLADKVGQPNLEAIFPKSFGDWVIDRNTPVILPAPDVQARLDKIYNQVLSRTYVNKRGERIMLSVAYGGDQSDGTRLHRPEVCYPAQGFQITSNRATDLQLPGKNLHIRQLTSKLDQRFEPITYWVIVGDEAVTSATQQKLAQLSYGVRGLIPDGMLMRVSSIDMDSERAFGIQSEFLQALALAVPPESHARIFGK
ncbi:EpsI family protein [Paucibacter sp. B2R-40]|uniref:exosortase-associated protein EpsI, B-type n=1 Tax=Paucibacter sp. B2R-40 TaxID=2893554 RepID=UPI0021E4CFB2|nr:exosortase-associated protein EpsI, B-type [Paucibacter sp. B2R-40]MCV2357157.1 EpsI family protein [Paucibacter sp. B2R-40]